MCLRFFTTKMNFVTGSENIMTVWRSKVLDAKAVTCFSLKNFFDTPDKAMKIYFADNSGINPQPQYNSSRPPKDRYYYLTRKETVGFFNGPGLKHFGNRFGALLTKEIHQMDLEMTGRSTKTCTLSCRNFLLVLQSRPCAGPFCSLKIQHSLTISGSSMLICFTSSKAIRGCSLRGHGRIGPGFSVA